MLILKYRECHTWMFPNFYIESKRSSLSKTVYILIDCFTLFLHFLFRLFISGVHGRNSSFLHLHFAVITHHHFLIYAMISWPRKFCHIFKNAPNLFHPLTLSSLVTSEHTERKPTFMCTWSVNTGWNENVITDDALPPRLPPFLYSA